MAALWIARLYSNRTARHTTRVHCCSLPVPSQTALRLLPLRSIPNAGLGRRIRSDGPPAEVASDRVSHNRRLSHSPSREAPGYAKGGYWVNRDLAFPPL